MPCGIKLVIEDYPYAADGLLIWSAIKDWLESYVEHFYSDPNSVTSDVELQSWWKEIRCKGHYYKRNEPWWPTLDNKQDLSGILTQCCCKLWTISLGRSVFLSSLPTQLQATKVMAVEDTHSPDEEYLGQVNPEYSRWINDHEILKLFNKFSARLEEIQEIRISA
ncbi:hypothetical protein L6164_010725 [Bauhinia variegata]|uniref:Uncharacterized protein n=1 Tax=Bauhinia variegata TaxID=167791 RepID=A0ACB9P5N6_BAUVA|nr:hypothetical protein L6164_010725 [Bauhinia variegata]